MKYFNFLACTLIHNGIESNYFSSQTYFCIDLVNPQWNWKTKNGYICGEDALKELIHNGIESFIHYLEFSSAQLYRLIHNGIESLTKGDSDANATAVNPQWNWKPIKMFAPWRIYLYALIHNGIERW